MYCKISDEYDCGNASHAISIIDPLHGACLNLNYAYDSVNKAVKICNNYSSFDQAVLLYERPKFRSFKDCLLDAMM